MMMQGGFSGPMLRLDASITRQKVRPGTVQRIFPYAMAYRWMLVLLLLVTAIDSAVQVANPLLLGLVIDLGILPHRIGIVIALSLAIAAMALVDAGANYLSAWLSARIGQRLVLNLLTQVFSHVQQQ